MSTSWTPATSIRPQIVAAQEDYAAALQGPVRPDYQWRARNGTGFTLDDFRLD